MRKSKKIWFLIFSAISCGISLPVAFNLNKENISNLINVNKKDFLAINKNNNITKNKKMNNILAFGSYINKYTKAFLGEHKKWYGGDPDRNAKYYKNINSNEYDFEKANRNFIIGKNIKSESYEHFSKIKINLKKTKLNHFQKFHGGIKNQNDWEIEKRLENPYTSNAHIRWGSMEFNQNPKEINNNLFTNEISFNLNSKFTVDSKSNLNANLVWNELTHGVESRDYWWSWLRLLLVQNNNNLNSFHFNFATSLRTDGTLYFEFDDPFIVNYLSQREDFNYDIILPYSLYDLETFVTFFKQTFSTPFRINDAQSPIIFDYVSNTSNENMVRKEVEKRIENFYNKSDILNKFGAITKNGKSTGITEIELVIPDNIRGKAGSLTKEIKVKFKLSDKDAKFHFYNREEALNSIEVSMPIFIQLNPEIDYSFNDIIEIYPYNSAGNSFNKNWIISKDLRFNLSENNPDPNTLNYFNININKRNQIGELLLIEQDKLPVISKYGTILKFDFEIKLNDYLIKLKDVEFNRIFNNGKLFKTIDLNKNSEYRKSNIKINHDPKTNTDLISFGLHLDKDKINIYNASPINLTTIDNKPINLSSVSIKLTKASVAIPQEQNFVQSSWVEQTEGKIDDITDSTTNQKYQKHYAGKWETYDPFFFKLNALIIPVYDPITGIQIGFASRYKPFIREGLSSKKNTKEKDDDSIFPTPDKGDGGANYFADLGSYIMKKKTETGKVEFQIIVKEYSSKHQDYTKEVWTIDIVMNLITKSAEFKMVGYNEDNELIKKENEEKYFNKENPLYRGEYVNKTTGMYKPKIVWVNSYPPETFLYDPQDENNKLIIPENPTDDELKNARYDVGYIAQLNATGFTEKDYSSNPTFGGYETIFDTQLYTPTGLIPYSEAYTYNQNSLIPYIERSPLSQSGLQTIKSSDDFRQIVLRRPNTNTYLYQFIKISSSDDIKNYKSDLIGLYGSYIGLKNKPLFVDFWDTYQGKHLMSFLINEYKIIENEEKVRELEYYDVIQYWNIYVNNPKFYSQGSNSSTNNTYSKNIKELVFTNDSFSIEYLDLIRKKVKEQIGIQLNQLARKKGWIGANDLEYGIHYKIEEENDLFEYKLKQLQEEYSKPLIEAKFIEFEIIMLDEAFKEEIIKLTGKNTIKFLNNKDANKIIDLSLYQSRIANILINTSDESVFDPKKDLAKQVKDIILTNVSAELENIVKKSGINFGNNFVPQLNVDYKLRFYAKYYENDEIKIKYYKNIDDAINFKLLYEHDLLNFNNDLFIEVEAIFDDKSHFMKNSYTKWVNNSSSNKGLQIIKPYDLSNIKVKDLKINTQDKNFPEQDDKNKAQYILNLFIERVNNNILFWARNWISTNKINLSFKIDFDIRFIKSINENNQKTYYDDPIEAIEQVLLLNIKNEPNFDRTLEAEIFALKNEDHYNATGFFVKKINNSYLNKAIEEEEENVILDDLNNPDGSISGVDINNVKPNNSSTSIWWIITPITVFVIILISAIIVFVIRKNRRIR